MPPVHRDPRAAKGEGPPSAEELRRLLPTMRRSAERAGIRDPAEVRDVADEALFRAWYRRHAFKGFPGKREASLRAWVRVIARYVASERLRAATNEHVAIEGFRHWHAPFDPGPEPKTEASSTLLHALAMLKPRARLTMIIVGFHENTREAAASLRIKLSTAYTRARTARTKMRRRLR